MVCAQVRGLPTLFFISPDPNKDAIRTEGLIPLQMMRDIINNEMWRREALNCHRNPWFLLLVLVYLIQINCLLLVLYVIYFIFVVWFCRDLFALNEIPWIARMYFFFYYMFKFFALLHGASHCFLLFLFHKQLFPEKL